MPSTLSIPEQFVVSIGEILWDVVGNQRYLGGAPFNFAYHSRCLGARSAIISRVSRDDLGADLIHRAENLRVDTRGIQRDPEYSTGIVTADTRSDGSITYIFPDECAWDHIRFNDLDRELLDFATIICFGTLAQRQPGSRSAIMAAISSAPSNALTFLDLNLRAPYYSREIISPCLNAARIVKMNESEVTELREMYQLSGDDETAVLQLMERFDIETAVLTRGALGASAWSRNKSAHLRGYEVPTADCIGCGDAFGAAFVLSLASGQSLEQSLELANLTGAYVSTQHGATPQYTVETLKQFRHENPLPHNGAPARVHQSPSA